MSMSPSPRELAQTTSPLLGLPREIRDIIFEYCNEDEIYIALVCSWATQAIIHNSPTRGLFYTNGQIQNEYLEWIAKNTAATLIGSRLPFGDESPSDPRPFYDLSAPYFSNGRFYRALFRRVEVRFPDDCNYTVAGWNLGFKTEALKDLTGCMPGIECIRVVLEEIRCPGRRRAIDDARLQALLDSMANITEVKEIALHELACQYMLASGRRCKKSTVAWREGERWLTRRR